MPVQNVSPERKATRMKAHVSAAALAEVAGWHKSRRSGAAGHCVEVADFDGGKVVRNSNDPDAGGLRFTGDEWTAFVEGAKAGEFG